MSNEKDPRGGNTTTKCVALTSAGHRCTKRAVLPGNLCHIHLRKSKAESKPKASSNDLQDILDSLEVDDIDPPSMHAGMMFLVSCWSGHVKESKVTGGDGDLHEVPLSGKDRIAAVNTWLMRYSTVYGEGESDAEAAIRAIRDALPISTE